VTARAGVWRSVPLLARGGVAITSVAARGRDPVGWSVARSVVARARNSPHHQHATCSTSPVSRPRWASDEPVQHRVDGQYRVAAFAAASWPARLAAGRSTRADGGAMACGAPWAGIAGCSGPPAASAR
jgi:hypothetical protein